MYLLSCPLILHSGLTILFLVMSYLLSFKPHPLDGSVHKALDPVLEIWAICDSLKVFLLTFVERKISFLPLKIAREWYFTFQHSHIVTT